MSVVLSLLRAVLPDRAPGRTRRAVVGVCVAILCGATPLGLASAATTAQTDRCGHTAMQRRLLRNRLSQLGASDSQTRRVMKRCKRREGVPLRYRRRPTHEQPMLLATGCQSRIVERGRWRGVGGTLMDVTFKVNYCYRTRRKVVVFKGWDVRGDTTTLGGLQGWSWEGVTERDGYYNAPCRINGKHRRRGCYLTWAKGLIEVCILRVGCLGEKQPYERVEIMWGRPCCFVFQREDTPG